MNGYLSITRWPDGADEVFKVRTIANAIECDPYSARLIAVRPAPLVVGRYPLARCEVMIERLRDAGVGAFAPSAESIQSIKSTPRVRALLPADGAPTPMYTVEFWDGRTTPLKSKDIVLLVRARLESSATRIDSRSQSAGRSMATTMMFGLEGAMLARALEGSTVSKSTAFSSSHMLDLYVRNGTRVRINGDKFNFDVLGHGKLYSDLQNMDLLATRLGTEAPNAVIDTGFKNFKCPADVLSDAFAVVGESSVRRNNDASPFDFYSAWTYLANKSEGILGSSLGG